MSLLVAILACSSDSEPSVSSTTAAEDSGTPPKSVSVDESLPVHVLLSQLEGDVSHYMALTSPNFADGETIPGKHACYGQNISPPMSWSDVPAGTKSFAILTFETDETASDFKGDWSQWVLFNISPDITDLPESLGKTVETSTVGAISGTNDKKRLDWYGPCPPFGPGSSHTYYFKLYALDIELDLIEGATKLDVVKSISGHILGYGEMMGTYRVKW